MKQSKSEYVFTREDNRTPLSIYLLDDQQAKTRKLLKLPVEAVLYCARHTALTELAKHADEFALKSIAGHADVRTT